MTDLYKRIEMHLGTLVEISIRTESRAIAHLIMEEAFTEIATIHRLMSFHLSSSDVSRLNRSAALYPLRVDPRTIEVIRRSCEMSQASDGRFDITVAPMLVNSGCLPAPVAACVPHADANWEDIEFVAEDQIYFRKPLWVDLGGIGKGYAVDAAFEKCERNKVTECSINAGGDVRLNGVKDTSIVLNVPGHDPTMVPVLELARGSVASSCGWSAAVLNEAFDSGPHFDGVSRLSIDPRRFTAVLAESCLMADALTKVVLALGEDARPLLSRCNATALFYDPETGWKQIAGSRDESPGL
ncbi:FAD:protein FMN transferase [Haliea sp. E1-2-M8]|uniref:FAD:protein FMN transferase n=1 Tax=Haliea sp. E1-2-M8 TaxID=3064706 RepID=UPI00272906C4|nr:FAD:protein FMN transferase [Haliea sp. E1-2-M8]MDO8863617.1 FAD:protein FMN transferase [Haliea sp. E1-2-M8]